MNPKTRAMLDQIQEFLLANEDDSGKELWDFMGIVRGPDQDNEEADLKYTYTAPLRAAIFPKIAELYVEINGATPRTNSYLFHCIFASARKPSYYDSHGHYARHISNAMEHLSQAEIDATITTRKD